MWIWTFDVLHVSLLTFPRIQANQYLHNRWPLCLFFLFFFGEHRRHMTTWLLFPVMYGEDFTATNRTTNHSIWFWVPLPYHPVVLGHLGPNRWPLQSSILHSIVLKKELQTFPGDPFTSCDADQFCIILSHKTQCIASPVSLFCAPQHKSLVPTDLQRLYMVKPGVSCGTWGTCMAVVHLGIWTWCPYPNLQMWLAVQSCRFLLSSPSHEINLHK